MRRIRVYGQPEPIPKSFLEEHRIQFEEMGQKHGLSLLYAHGSIAQNQMGPLSDIDMAVRFLPQRNKEPFTGLTNVLGDLVEIFHRDDIDVVDLDRVSPLLRYLVAAHGVCLFHHAEEERVNFEYDALRNYLDTIQLRHLYFEGLASAIQTGHFYS